MAETGQADTQDGIGAMHAGCLHEGVTIDFGVLRFHRAIAVHLDQVEGIAADVSSGVSHSLIGQSRIRADCRWLALQAATQALQPMHRVAS
jgi:hypothetical protein